MTAKVEFTIVPAADVARQDAIELLENVLEKARAGGIIAVAIACVAPSGGSTRAISESDDLGRLLGAVTLLRRFVEDEILERSTDR